MTKKNYHPENYWSDVANRMETRDEDGEIIAGDDEPYYRYKREKFLELLQTIDFSGKKVLEVGCGPGGNLVEVSKLSPGKLVGADISQKMVSLAKKRVPDGIDIVKTNGTELPFADNSFDIVFTATVLQHVTDEKMLSQLMEEICRVSSDSIYIFEKVDKDIIGDELCMARPVNYYSDFMGQFGFNLLQKKPINIRMSYYVSGAIRKGLNPKSRKEGEPLNGISIFAQNLTLPLTQLVDNVWNVEKDLVMMQYKFQKNE